MCELVRMPPRAGTAPPWLWSVSTSWLVLLAATNCYGQLASPGGPASLAAGSELSKASADDELARDVRELVRRLDAEQFSERNEATRQLLAKGALCVPLLIESLGSESREARFRVAGILRGSFTFDDMASHLIGAIDKKYGAEARLILRDRALLQVAEAAEMENTKTLFAFWGTDIEALRRRVLFDLMDVRGGPQAGDVVAPLIGLRDKAEQFDKVLSRLSDMSLAFDHRHSPGFLIAQTLAQGLLHDDQRQIGFTHHYVESLENLAQHLQREELSGGAIRKEIADRANMSDGAAAFLVRMLDENGTEYRTMTQRLGVSAAMIQSEFFRGLSQPDTKECFRCVGKVHIADMLLESLDEWPAAPDDGVVRHVIDCIVTTIASGDKPKALALLDALQGCGDLARHNLDVRAGWGQRLATRLCLAAQVAPNSREYHPVRAIHDRIVRLIDLGIQPDHDLFPRDFADRYLASEPACIDENSRAALGRYVRILEELGKANESLEQTGVRQFLLLMVASLLDKQQLLEAGASEVTDWLDRQKQGSPEDASKSLDATLGTWAQERITGMAR